MTGALSIPRKRQLLEARPSLRVPVHPPNNPLHALAVGLGSHVLHAPLDAERIAPRGKLKNGPEPPRLEPAGVPRATLQLPVVLAQAPAGVVGHADVGFSGVVHGQEDVEVGQGTARRGATGGGFFALGFGPGFGFLFSLFFALHITPGNRFWRL